MNNVKNNRDKYIGGSDIPAIFELMRYPDQNKYDCWKGKVEGKIINDFMGYMKIGTDSEHLVTDAVNSQLGFNFKPGTYYKNRDNGLDYRTNVDGYDKDKKALLEVKCRLKPCLNMYEILQSHFYVHVLREAGHEVDFIYVAVAKIHGALPKIEDDFYLFKLEINEELIEVILDECYRFEQAIASFFTKSEEYSLKDKLSIMEIYDIVKWDSIKIKKEEDIRWQEYFQAMSQRFTKMKLK